jgi:hypothetical protein
MSTSQPPFQPLPPGSPTPVARGASKPDRRESVVDRRIGLNRRELAGSIGDSSLDTNLERRRGPGRRRTDFLKAADEGELTHEQFLFLMAIEAFKKVNGKTFPSWTDVLEVIRRLGYRKTMPSALNLGGRVEDWTEEPDAPCGVDRVTAEENEIEEAA